MPSTNKSKDELIPKMPLSNKGKACSAEIEAVFERDAVEPEKGRMVRSYNLGQLVVIKSFQKVACVQKNRGL